MKNIAWGALLVSLVFFAAGCSDTAKQKDKVERTVKTNEQTGQTTIKEEGQHTETDEQTGAKVETSVDKETTVKPADENADGASVNETTEPEATKDEAPDAK